MMKRSRNMRPTGIDWTLDDCYGLVVLTYVPITLHPAGLGQHQTDHCLLKADNQSTMQKRTRTGRYASTWSGVAYKDRCSRDTTIMQTKIHSWNGNRKIIGYLPLALCFHRRRLLPIGFGGGRGRFFLLWAIRFRVRSTCSLAVRLSLVVRLGCFPLQFVPIVP